MLMNHQTRRSTRLQKIGQSIQKTRVLHQTANVVVHPISIVQQSTIIMITLTKFGDVCLESGDHRLQP